MEVRKCLVRTTGPPFHLAGVEQRGSRRRLPRAGTEGQESGRFRRVLSAANMVSSSSSFWWTAVRTRRHSGHRFGPVHTTALTPRGRGRFRTRAPECCGRGPVLALAMQRLGRARQAFSPSGGDACWIGHQRAGRNRRPHMQGMPSEARESQRHVNLDPVSGPRPHGGQFSRAVDRELGPVRGRRSLRDPLGHRRRSPTPPASDPAHASPRPLCLALPHIDQAFR